MDIQKEREAFENHLKKMGKTDNETFSKNEDDSYQMDIIHFGWKIWQSAKAQAVPEGFVLVKMDDLELLRDSAIKIKYASLNNDSDRIFSDIEDIQLSIERLIEEQEPAND